MTLITPFWGILAVIASVVLFFLSSINIWILLKGLRPLAYQKFFRHYLYGFIVTLVAPGQMGDASLTLFLKKEGIPIRQSSVVYILDKSMTFLIFMSVSAWGAGLLFEPLRGIRWLVMVPLAGFVLFWTMAYCSLSFFARLNIFKKMDQWLEGAKDTLDILKTRWDILAVNFILAWVKWGVLSLCYFFAFLAFQKWVDWPAIGIIPILSSLAGYIPISLSGIGITEMAAVYLFSLQGVEKSVVLSAYIFLRLIQFAMAGIVLLFFEKSNSFEKESILNEPAVLADGESR